MENDISRNCEPEPAWPGHFALANEVTGEFLNQEEFRVKDIAMGGFLLLSNYSPLIGESYEVRIRYGGGSHPFRLQVVNSRLACIQGRPKGVIKAGMVYAISCRILFESEFQKKLVLTIIQNDCGLPVIAGSAGEGFEMLPAI